MRARAFVLVLLVPAFAGCTDWTIGPACPEPVGGILTGPTTSSGSIARTQSSDIPVVYWARNPANETAYVFAGFEPRDGGYVGTSLTRFNASGQVPQGGSGFGVVLFSNDRSRISSSLTPSKHFDVNLRLWHAGCGIAGTRLAGTLTLADDAPGEVVQPGLGAQVRTAGFWPNGTLFYTNMDRVHNDSSLARAGWYDFEGGSPLAVYVYNASRTERPARYNESARPFATTIEGFNQALKGMHTTQSKVVLIPPEKAYTLRGRESHPLFGDALVFYIEVADVVAINCPLPAGPTCDPRDSLPPLPTPPLAARGPT